MRSHSSGRPPARQHPEQTVHTKPVAERDYSTVPRFLPVDRLLAAMVGRSTAAFVADLTYIKQTSRKDSDGFFPCSTKLLESLGWSRAEQHRAFAAMRPFDVIDVKMALGCGCCHGMSRWVRVRNDVLEDVMEEQGQRHFDLKADRGRKS